MPIVMTKSRVRVPGYAGSPADVVRDMPKPGVELIPTDAGGGDMVPPVTGGGSMPLVDPMQKMSSIVSLAIGLPFLIYIAASRAVPGWARLVALGLAGTTLYVHGSTLAPNGATPSTELLTWEEEE